MTRVLVVVGGVIAGLLAGATVHRVSGRRSQNEHRAAAGAPQGRSDVEKGRSGVLQQDRDFVACRQRVSELERQLTVAEREHAELIRHAKTAPATAASAETRELKVRRFGRLGAKVIRVSVTEGPAGVQRMMGEILSLGRDLDIQQDSPVKVYEKPDFMAAILEGALEEGGIGIDAAEREVLRAAADARLGKIADETPRMRKNLAVGGLVLEFFDRYGERLFERDAAYAVQLMNTFGTPSSTVTLSAPAQSATEKVTQDVRKAAGMDEAAAIHLRPVVDRWTGEYAALLEKTRAQYGDGVVDHLLRGDAPKPPTFDAARKGLQFKIELMDLHARLVDEVVRVVPDEAAKKLRGYDRLHLFGEIKP